MNLFQFAPNDGGPRVLLTIEGKPLMPRTAGHHGDAPDRQVDRKRTNADE